METATPPGTRVGGDSNPFGNDAEHIYAGRVPGRLAKGQDGGNAKAMKTETGVLPRRIVLVLLAAALPLLAASSRPPRPRTAPMSCSSPLTICGPCWAAMASRLFRPPASTGWPPGGPPSGGPTARLPMQSLAGVPDVRLAARHHRPLLQSSRLRSRALPGKPQPPGALQEPRVSHPVLRQDLSRRSRPSRRLVRAQLAGAGAGDVGDGG